MNSYETVKEDIKRAADIVDLIGQYVQLKKAGQNYQGLCPFHSEKAPSFTVSPSKQIFHCFGCKKGGDIFTFWMEYHRVTFMQALKDLAEAYRIQLPSPRLSRSEKRQIEIKDILFKINGLAADYYHRIIRSTREGAPGKKYIEKRSLTDETIQTYKIGYAPSAWDTLTTFLKKKNLDMDKAVQAGLVIPKKNGGHYDRFRGRIIFPIFNLREQVVGFGGRVLDDSLPKYINTPETAIFHKGTSLYGLHAAYPYIREKGRAVIVEGYTDVLALREHGFLEAVATLGTALTRNHIRGIKGYAKEAVVVFDSDDAGKKAALKSLSHFLHEGLPSKVLILPQGYDPDSFVNHQGLQEFLDHLEKAKPMFEFYIDSRLADSKGETEDLIRVVHEILPLIAKLPGHVQKAFYTQRLAERIGLDESIIRKEMGNIRDDRSGPSPFGEKTSPESGPKLADYDFLDLIVHHPEAMERLSQIDYEMIISDPATRDISRSCFDRFHKEGDINLNRIIETLEEKASRELLREVMMSPSRFPQDVVAQVISELGEKAKALRQGSVSAALQQGGLEKANALLQKKRSRLSKSST